MNCNGSTGGAVHTWRIISDSFAPNRHRYLVWPTCYFDQEQIKKTSSQVVWLACTTSLFSRPFCRWLMLAAYSETLWSCLAKILPITTCCRFFNLCRHYLDPLLSRNQASIRLWIHDSIQNSCLLHKGRLTGTRPVRACVTILLDKVDLMWMVHGPRDTKTQGRITQGCL